MVCLSNGGILIFEAGTLIPISEGCRFQRDYFWKSANTRCGVNEYQLSYHLVITTTQLGILSKLSLVSLLLHEFMRLSLKLTQPSMEIA